MSLDSKATSERLREVNLVQQRCYFHIDDEHQYSVYVLLVRFDPFYFLILDLVLSCRLVAAAASAAASPCLRRLHYLFNSVTRIIADFGP